MQKIISVPYIDQTEQYPTGCESISAVMMLQYLGYDIPFPNLHKCITQQILTSPLRYIKSFQIFHSSMMRVLSGRWKLVTRPSITLKR